MIGYSMRQYPSILVVMLLMLLGCSDSESPSHSLLVTIQNQGGNYEISEYQVVNHPYRTNNQQGQYQAHLLNNNNEILQKISFDKLIFPGTQTDSEGSNVQLILPKLPDLYQLKIYQLDGSSGHYKLDASNPLLTWTLPDSTRN